MNAFHAWSSNSSLSTRNRTLLAFCVLRNKRITPADTKVFPVPVPTTAQVSDLHEKFSERQEIFDLIENLEGTIVQKRAEQWPHADLDS